MRYSREKMQRARERLGYSIEMVGEQAGLSKNSVLRAEHEGDIRPLTARKIASALGVEVVDLIKEGTVAPKAPAPPQPEVAEQAGQSIVPVRGEVHITGTASVDVRIYEIMKAVANHEISPEEGTKQAKEVMLVA